MTLIAVGLNMVFGSPCREYGNTGIDTVGVGRMDTRQQRHHYRYVSD
jgi:hypothetical protein